MLAKARFVLNKQVTLKKYAEMEAIADTVSYSVKTNYEVAKVLEGTEAWFSVHSLEALKSVGPKERVWFFAQGWSEQEIREIFALGTCSFVVDNEKDLDVFLKVIGETKKECDLLLRMRLKEHTVHTGKHFVFGLYSEKVNRLVPGLRENKHIKRLGVHFHRKTQNVSEWSLKEELEDALTKETLAAIDTVNIGGGIPAEYKNFRTGVLGRIFKKIEELKTWLNEQDVEMIIEPGRYIAAPSVRLKATITNIYQDNIVIDCSVYNAAMDTFIANIRLLVEGEKEKGDAFTIKGCTPDSLDIFRYRAFLKSPKIGDTIVFKNAGAYNFATDFCKLPRLETVVE